MYNQVCVYNVMPEVSRDLSEVSRDLYRFHGALLDHLLQYQYSIVGALQLIQDLHRYKQTVQHFKVRKISQTPDIDSVFSFCLVF